MQQPSSSVSEQPPRRKRRLFLLLGGALLLLLWAAPILVAHSPLRDHLAQHLLSDLHGGITVGRASLGWFSPIVLHDVEVSDAEGRPVLAAPQIVSERRLLGLLWDRSDLGRFRCEGATLHLVCSAQETNLERVLESWLKPTGAETVGSGVSLECVEATVEICDEAAGEAWTLHPVEMSLLVPREAEAPVAFKLSAAHAHAAHPGRLDVEMQVHRPATAAQTSGNNGTLKARAQQVPLGLLGLAFRRIEPSTRASGWLSGQVDGMWQDKGPNQFTARLEGRLSAQDLTLVGSPLGEDRVRLHQLDLPCKLGTQGNRLTVEKAQLNCDVGKVSLTGTFDVARGVGSLLVQPGYEADADLDLARLAALLPHTLRLRRDSAVTAGRLQGHLRSQASPGGVIWDGRLSTSELRGTSRGQPWTWPEPVAAAFVVRQVGDALPVIELLRCQSDFLKVDASGGQDRLIATATYDLGRLSAHLGQFVDLTEVHLSGEGSSRIVLEPVGSRLGLNLDLTVQDLVCGSSSAPAWREPQLQLHAAGQYDHKDGWLRLEPILTTLCEGKLRLEPSLRLAPGPMELVLGKGSALERARVTPALCASVLQYALPALAEMTEGEGQLSLVLDAGRVPLASPAASEVSGRVTIHSARLGPSPLLRELSILLKGPSAATLTRESVVSFRLADGRVHHEGLELAFPDLTVRTQGSVGLDGSLALVAEFPVPPKWLGSGTVSQAVAKQMVRLPISGTLQQPRLEEQALRTAIAQFAHDTARDVLRQEVENQFKRLLRPRDKQNPK